MVRTGKLVLVVGPSGAGKDTLIDAARRELADDADFVFPRRIVTRQATASAEDHISVTPEEFGRRQAAGAFALSWEAHGLQYGLPASLVDDIAAGRIVVMNGSRAMIAAAVERFPNTRVILVEAPAAIRAERLARRGREPAEEIGQRLAREVAAPLPDAIRVDNAGMPEEGIAGFVAALHSLRAD